MPDTQQAGFAKLLAMIDAMDVAMLTTEDEGGNLRSRPMATQKAEDGVFWFFTSADSPKVDEIEGRSHVNLSYAAPDAQIYVSVSGLARLVRDREKMRELWTEDVRRWFPQGLDSPDIALLEVRMTHAEYWDVDKRQMRELLDAGASREELEKATDHQKLS